MLMAQDKDQKTLNVPPLRFPGFTDEWKKTTLGEIGSGFNYGLNAPAKEFDGVNKYIRITDIDDSSGAYIKDNEVSPNGILTQDYIVQDNDILLARTGASTGKSYLYNPNDGKLYFAGFLIRFNVSSANPYFVYSILHTRNYWKWVSIMSARSGQPGINSQEYSSYSLNIPSQEEQDRIASLLQLLDERIATQNKIIEDLKKLKSAIIDSIMDNSNYQRIRFEELYDKASEGGTPSTSISEYYTDGTIPFVKIEDLSKKYLFDSKDHITELGLCKSSAWIIPTNSIIYSNGATIGAISINKIPICTKQGILGIIPKKEFDVEYLYYFMSSTYFRKQVERIVTEGTMRTAYLKDINHIECPIPDLEEQNSISQMLRSISNKIDTEQTLLTAYVQHKDYLLKYMFI
ncbi:MAG: restriction endonuclease subunit S [Bacteroidales bacterium]|nr:restriction endonuclease subunit S [Bacteroidales bacterium]